MPQSGAPQPPADFDRIVPRRPAGAGGDATAGRPSEPGGTRRSIAFFWIATAALAVSAVIVFALLPRWIDGDGASPAAPAAAPPTVATAPVPTPEAPAEPSKPAWADPALLEARAAAQSARSQYQAQSGQLQSRAVERWGATASGQAAESAKAGEAAFTARDFTAARSAFEAAAATTAALLAEVPQRLASALDAGNRALDAGDKAAAQQAFELARAIEADNAAATRGLKRVAALDEVRAQLDAARRLEQAGDVAGARAAFKQALALDPDTGVARDALARLDADARDAEFRRALGEALAALDRAQYDVAETRLARARALNAADPGVQQVAARLAEARRAQSLANLQRESTAQAASEDWGAAVATYRKALQIDPTVAFARDGLAQAEPRAALAQRLQDFVDRPGRLSAPAVAAEAEKALAEARAVTSPGPRLDAQRVALERALAAAATPVTVQLRSDGKTEVTVYRVGTLGAFTNRALELKPGRYVAVGTRAGYRDVRQEFEVAAGMPSGPVDVRCVEPL